MKTVKISRRAKTLNALLYRARRENFVLRSPDGDEFILAQIDDFDREIELTRQNKQLMKFLERRARQNATVSLAEAKRQLGIL